MKGGNEMKRIILIIIFIVVVTGMSEAADPIIRYYNNTYTDDHAYIAWFIGIVVAKLRF